MLRALALATAALAMPPATLAASYAYIMLGPVPAVALADDLPGYGVGGRCAVINDSRPKGQGILAFFPHVRRKRRGKRLGEIETSCQREVLIPPSL